MIIELKNIHVEERVFIVTGECPIGSIAMVESDSQA